FRLSGAASAGIVLLPIVIALVAYWRRGGFDTEEGLLNADDSSGPAPELQPAPEPAARSAAKWQPLTTRARLAAVALLVLGIAAVMIPADRFGDEPKYNVSEAQALAASNDFLRAQGLDPSAFGHVTAPSSNWDGNGRLTGKYFLE